MFHRLLRLDHATCGRCGLRLAPPPAVALTSKGGLPYKPRDFGRGDPRQFGGAGKPVPKASEPFAPREQPTVDIQRPAENDP